MKDERVSVTRTVAYSTWTGVAALFALVMVTGELRIFAGMVLAVGIAATATVRTYFVEFSNMVPNAFELGRDSVTALPKRP